MTRAASSAARPSAAHSGSAAEGLPALPAHQLQMVRSVLQSVFAYFDGDNIGSQLELLLLDDQMLKAAHYSQDVNRAIMLVQVELEKASQTEILLAGGDDLVATWPKGAFSLARIDFVRSLFQQTCGRTLSAGVAFTVSGAAHNLRRAKLMGKDQTCYEPGVWYGE